MKWLKWLGGVVTVLLVVALLAAGGGLYYFKGYMPNVVAPQSRL